MRARLALLACVLVVGACGGKDKVKAPPPPPKPEIRQLVLTAEPGINPDVGGRASPVVVRIYQLAEEGAFQRASIGDLLHDDAKALGESMKARKELVVTPGASVTVALERAAGATLVAVAVGFRDPGARWKALAPWSEEDLPVRLSTRELKIDVPEPEVEVPEKH